MAEFWCTGGYVEGRKMIDGKRYELTETGDHSFASSRDYQWVARDGSRAVLTDDEQAEVDRMKC